MNFIDTLKSVELVLATEEVPLIVGESGIGKTALANKLAENNNWSLICIDGNLLKEGEIGGLPTVETYSVNDDNGNTIEKKTTIYAVHSKLREVDKEILKGKTVLLFIDEINRCEHTVQQELMNLILNREINGYKLPQNVKILAAMNPSNKYGMDFDYQVVDMDAAQENRFVWLNMEPDYQQWIKWAIDTGIEEKVIEFISTFPEYLNKINEDDVRATPRSYERVSKSYKIYKDNKNEIPKPVFLNVIKGNVGSVIAEEFMSFVENDSSEVISFDDVFGGEFLGQNIIERVKNESHTRLYISIINILRLLELKIKSGEININKHSYNKLDENIEDSKINNINYYINRLIEFLGEYPVDLMVGVMKDIKSNYPEIYDIAIEKENFVECYFGAYRLIRS